MGEYFDIVNLDKREMFDADIFDQNIKRSGVGYGLQCSALMFLCATGSSWNHPRAGSWAGDRIIALGDDSPEYAALEDEYDSIKDIGGEVFAMMKALRPHDIEIIELQAKERGHELCHSETTNHETE